MHPIRIRPRTTIRAGGILLATLLLMAGCAGIHESKDFERHRYSQLSEPRDGKDALYFDVMMDAKYPEDDPNAEEIRMQWLDAWLDIRKMCPDGYRIDEKRDFDPMEYNPARYDKRYVIKCTPAPVS